jgi:transposase-like protein
MQVEFKNYVELMEYYQDENVCKTLLEQQRWGDKPVCPHCSHSDKIYRTNRGYKCSSCLKKFTVTVGTVFENSKIKLRYWFAAIYICSSHKKGISSHQLARDLGVTQKTAWFILHRVRKMLEENEPELLEGTIEIDETYVGGNEKNKHKQGKTGSVGRGIDKTPVIGMIQRGGKVRVSSVKNVQGRTLTDKVFKNVAIGSTVVTDQFRSYYMLRSRYSHESVNHSKDEFIRGSVHTNSIEGFFSHFKRTIYGTYHSISPKHLDAYCHESAFRYNTRKFSEQERFIEALKQCNGALSYKTLVAK